MITKIFRVSDTYTLMFFLVTVFEEVDRPICEKIGITPGFKVVNRMRGRVIDTFAGYRFDPDLSGESIKDQSKNYDIEGTSTAFGLLLSEISDIKKIPGTINVEQIREFWITTGRATFINDSIIEIIREYGATNLRKCLYSTPYTKHIALIDTVKDQVVFDVSSSSDLKHIVPMYLWIPVREGEIEYLKKIEICWFMNGFIKPEG